MASTKPRAVVRPRASTRSPCLCRVSTDMVQPIHQGYWTEQALTTFGRLFRGATAIPARARRLAGRRPRWRLVFDDTQMVLSYVLEGAFTDDDTVKRLRAVLCRMGREANQGEVGIAIHGTYIGIVDYKDGGARSEGGREGPHRRSARRFDGCRGRHEEGRLRRSICSHYARSSDASPFHRGADPPTPSGPSAGKSRSRTTTGSGCRDWQTMSAYRAAELGPPKSLPCLIENSLESSTTARADGAPRAD